MNNEIKQTNNMFEKLKALKENSHSPYSNYWVTCIVIAADGRSFNGVNVENCAFGDTICAERSALVSAISNGCKPQTIMELHLTSKNPGFGGGPCGSCRQVIVELLHPKAVIYNYNKEGEHETYSIKEILPYAFTGKSLNEANSK